MRLNMDNADLDAPDDKIAEPCHLLWALLLLKTYKTESVLAGLCGGEWMKTRSVNGHGTLLRRSLTLNTRW
jgi:hypothetical protein